MFAIITDPHGREDNTNLLNLFVYISFDQKTTANHEHYILLQITQ